MYAFGIKRLTLFAKCFSSERRIKILDIQSAREDRNLGYGSAAIEVLFSIGDAINVIKYTGFLSEDDINDHNDLEHKERIEHFYSKWGFMVDIKNRHIEKNL